MLIKIQRAMTMFSRLAALLRRRRRRPALNRVVIAQACWQQLNTAAQNAYPTEACGVLMGHVLNGTIYVAAVEITDNLMHKKDRAFAVAPATALVLRQLTKGIRVKIVGFFHSHPNHRAIPSDNDLVYAWPGHVYLIARVERGPAMRQWRAWQIEGNPRQARELRVEICEGKSCPPV